MQFPRSYLLVANGCFHFARRESRDRSRFSWWRRWMPEHYDVKMSTYPYPIRACVVISTRFMHGYSDGGARSHFQERRPLIFRYMHSLCNNVSLNSCIAGSYMPIPKSQLHDFPSQHWFFPYHRAYMPRCATPKSPNPSNSDNSDSLTVPTMNENLL